MSFIWKQGYQFSENGWPMIDAAELDFSPVPEIGWKVGVRIGVPNTLLKALMVRLHREVEPMDTSQCGVFTASNSMPNSNHNSGTALDYNWNKHPFQKWGTWGSNRAKVDKIVDDFRGTIEFGGNWTSPRDEMHFELHYGPNNQTAIDLANELYVDGLWNIFKKGGTPAEPGGTLPSGDGYLEEGSTGNDVFILQSELNRVFPKYKNTPVNVDGKYGPSTKAAVMEFQERAGIDVDGIVGPITRSAMAKNGVNWKAEVVTTPSGFVYPTTEEMTKQIWEQMFGVKASGWEKLFGKTADGKRGKFTVEAIADLHSEIKGNQ